MTTNWGIAGTGRIASDFARDLARVSDAKLVAVGSRLLTKATSFAQERHIAQAYGSIDELTNDPQVDVIYVAGIHPTHHQQAIAAMRAGKHVLVEKPLAMNAEQVAEMVATSRQTKRFLMEAMWMRFNPLHVELKRRLDAGEFGMITSIESDFSFSVPLDPSHRLFDPTKGGSALLDVGVYPITLAWWWLGEPTSWTATATIGQTGVDESVALELSWSSGQTASLTCGSTGAGTTTSTVTCESAVITIPSPSHCSPRAEIRNAQGTQSLQCDEPGLHHQVAEVHRCLALGSFESTRMPHSESHQIARFIDTVLTDIHNQ